MNAAKARIVQACLCGKLSSRQNLMGKGFFTFSSEESRAFFRILPPRELRPRARLPSPDQDPPAAFEPQSESPETVLTPVAAFCVERSGPVGSMFSSGEGRPLAAERS